MRPVRFRCGCGRELQADAGKAGVVAACPACGRELTIPSSGGEGRPSPAAGGGGGIVCAAAKRGVTDRRVAADTKPPEGDNPFALTDGSHDEDAFSDEDWTLIRRDTDRALILSLVGLVIVVTGPFAIYYGVRALRRIWASGTVRGGGAVDWFVDREKAIFAICCGGLVLPGWLCLGGAIILCSGV